MLYAPVSWSLSSFFSSSFECFVALSSSCFNLEKPVLNASWFCLTSFFTAWSFVCFVSRAFSIDESLFATWIFISSRLEDTVFICSRSVILKFNAASNSSLDLNMEPVYSKHEVIVDSMSKILPAISRTNAFTLSLSWLVSEI